jgi:hypothetical protein
MGKEKFEHIKGVTGSRKWPKEKRRKKQINDLQNITLKTKDRAIRTPLNPR